MKIEAIIESILYIAGEEGISISNLAELLELSKSDCEEKVESLKEHYSNEANSGLTILFVGGKIVLATKKEAETVLKKFAQAPFMTPLSKAALEILAIVAYNQPVTRVEIDAVRGVQSAGSLQKLVVRDLIKEVGRVDGPGRPLLYGTTNYFMNYFGINSLSELPELPKMNEDTHPQEIDLFNHKSLNRENEINK